MFECRKLLNLYKKQELPYGVLLVYNVVLAQYVHVVHMQSYIPTVNTKNSTYIHTHIHAYIHTYIHTYIHACMHTYIHTYMQYSIHIHIHAVYENIVMYVTVLFPRLCTINWTAVPQTVTIDYGFDLMKAIQTKNPHSLCIASLRGFTKCRMWFYKFNRFPWAEKPSNKTTKHETLSSSHTFSVFLLQRLYRLASKAVKRSNILSIYCTCLARPYQGKHISRTRRATSGILIYSFVILIYSFVERGTQTIVVRSGRVFCM